MNCHCPDHWLSETENIFTTEYGKECKICICVNCKKYYIEYDSQKVEVQFDYREQKWHKQ